MSSTTGAYIGDYRNSGSDKVRGTRSVVKANHVSAKKGSAKLGASLRYYATRNNSLEEKQERDIFTKNEDKVAMREVAEQLKTLTHDETYQVGYRIILSPDTPRDTSAEAMREWTREMMTKVEHNHKVTWFAVAHSGDNAHTSHAHVHVVAVMDRRINKEELAALRQYGDAHWQDIVTRQKMLERDAQHVYTHTPQQTPSHHDAPMSTKEHGDLSASQGKQQTVTHSYGPEL